MWDNVPEELAGADLLLHTCPIETFGMAVLEAMAANLPTLVPTRGERRRWFRMDTMGSHSVLTIRIIWLAKLVELKNAPAELLNRIAGKGVRRARRDIAKMFPLPNTGSCLRPAR